MTRLERNSCCKINLVLNVLGKRPDGFHELETVMQPVPVEDTLSFQLRPAAGVALTCNNPALPLDASNLVVRAAEAFLQAAKLERGLKIHLEKRIPIAAGLGGGSGNAAATLLALNELFGQPLDQAHLHGLAAALGSDVPFFLQDRPAWATGRGERVVPVEPFDCLRPVRALLVHPGFGVSTRWAYQALARFPSAWQGQRGRAETLISLLRQGELTSAARALYNSLEAPVLKKYPILHLFQEFLREEGALAALMSGSGSTTFALFADQASAESSLESFRSHFGERCWTVVVPLVRG